MNRATSGLVGRLIGVLALANYLLLDSISVTDLSEVGLGLNSARLGSSRYCST